MLTPVLTHVDALGRLADPGEGRGERLLRRTDEGDDGPVGRGPGVHVEHLDATGAPDRVDDLVDHRPIPTFAEVGYALDKLFGHRRLLHVLLPDRGGPLPADAGSGA